MWNGAGASALGRPPSSSHVPDLHRILERTVVSSLSLDRWLTPVAWEGTLCGCLWGHSAPGGLRRRAWLPWNLGTQNKTCPQGSAGRGKLLPPNSMSWTWRRARRSLTCLQRFSFRLWCASRHYSAASPPSSQSFFSFQPIVACLVSVPGAQKSVPLCLPEPRQLGHLRGGGSRSDSGLSPLCPAAPHRVCGRTRR